MEYTLHYQRGTRVGARSLRMLHTEADDATAALKNVAREAFQLRKGGYKLVRVDHFDADGSLVLDL